VSRSSRLPDPISRITGRRPQPAAFPSLRSRSPPMSQRRSPKPTCRSPDGSQAEEHRQGNSPGAKQTDWEESLVFAARRPLCCGRTPAFPKGRVVLEPLSPLPTYPFRSPTIPHSRYFVIETMLPSPLLMRISLGKVYLWCPEDNSSRNFTSFLESTGRWNELNEYLSRS